jgi:hypothetical protein
MKQSKYDLDHGRGTPRELFFLNLELLGFGRNFGLKAFEAFGVFPLFNHYFYKKLSLYNQHPNIHLE